MLRYDTSQYIRGKGTKSKEKRLDFDFKYFGVQGYKRRLLFTRRFGAFTGVGSGQDWECLGVLSRQLSVCFSYM